MLHRLYSALACGSVCYVFHTCTLQKPVVQEQKLIYSYAFIYVCVCVCENGYMCEHTGASATTIKLNLKKIDQKKEEEEDEEERGGGGDVCRLSAEIDAGSRVCE